MSRKLFRSVTCLFLVMSLAALHFPHVARAEMIGVQAMLNAQRRADKIARTRAFLHREDVRKEMVSLGVDPAEVSERVAALSDQELNMLAGHIDSLPAGAGAEGILAVIGVVFIVLIILELVGVTNVFSRF